MDLVSKEFLYTWRSRRNSNAGKKNVKRGLQDEVVLDLENAGDKVDRHTLLKVAERWIEDRLQNIGRPMLGPLRVRKKSAPTNYETVIS